MIDRRGFFGLLIGAIAAPRLSKWQSFTEGSQGFLDFGAGTLAMLHGREAIMPLKLHLDGKEMAEFIVPFIPSGVPRLDLRPTK